MKKIWIIGAVSLLALAACNSKDADTKAAAVPGEEQVVVGEASCQEGDPGYPTCTTGGGVNTGPIRDTGQNSERSATDETPPD